MRNRLFAAALALIAALPCRAQAAEASPFAQIPDLVTELSRITGLKPLKSVQHDVMTREELRKFLDARVKEELKPEEVRIQELALKRMGLVPAEFKLAESMVDLMAEQAEAFYDYRKKKLFLVDADGGSPIQEAALLHELAHALADQHFHLEKYIKRGKSDDSSLARAAVMEGQATWLMYEWMAAKAGQSLRKTPALSSMLGSRSGSMGSQYPVLGAAPLYLRASLLFPYTAGLQFQQAVLEKLGDVGFSAVFKNPPETSQHILHPEMYFAGTKPLAPQLPKLASQGRYDTALEATAGEFDHSILLEQYAGRETAELLAPKWRGGMIRLLESKKDKRAVLVYASEWASPEAARDFFEAYRKVLGGKWKSVSYVQQKDGWLEGTGDAGVFRVRLQGASVTSVEGVESADELRP